MNASINSIYLSTEGEGIFVGLPQIFVRFQGCRVGCLNCDSKETWDFDRRFFKPVDEVVHDVNALSQGVRRVSITGGDPLHPKHLTSLRELIGKLKEKNYWINLEASGTRIVPDIFQLVDFISFDVKTPSTGVRCPEECLEELTLNYKGRFQVKSVVETQEDFDFVDHIYKRDANFPWVLTPAYNRRETWPGERIKHLLSLNERTGGKFRVIVQQHKAVYGPDKRDV